VIRQLLHKFFSVSLALLVLCSTLSFTVEKHYCGPFLVDVAVFNHAEKCGMDVISSTETSKEDKKMSCCKDEVELLQNQDELKVLSFEDLKFEQQLFITAYAYSYISLFKELKYRVTSLEYPPPLIVKQRFKLDEAYLI